MQHCLTDHYSSAVPAAHYSRRGDRLTASHHYAEARGERGARGERARITRHSRSGT